MKKLFDKDYLVETLGLPRKSLEKRAIGFYGPFHIEFEIVFKDKDGKYWRTTYRTGREPWSGKDEIECVRVKRAPVVKWKFVDYDADIDMELFDLLMGDDLK